MRRRKPNFFYVGRFQHRVLENPFICSAEPDGDGDGGGSGGGGGGSDNKDKPDFSAQFTEFQTSITDTLRNITAEITQIKKSRGTPVDLTSVTTAISELKSELAAIKEGNSPKKEESDDKKDGVDDATKQQMSQLEKQLKTLTTALEQEKTKAKEAEDKREASEARQRGLERDRMIVAAYRAAGGRDDVDDKAVLRHFRDEFAYSDNETWVTEDGMDITGFIKKNLPAYMKKPKNASGGGGGTTPEQQDTPTIAQLEERALEAGQKAKKAGIGTRESHAYNQALNALKEAGGNVAAVKDAVVRL